MATGTCPDCHRAFHHLSMEAVWCPQCQSYFRPEIPAPAPHADGPHDLAGLEAFLALVRPLDEALTALDQYRTQHRAQLRPSVQQGLDATIRSLACTVQTLYDHPEPWKGEA